MYIPNDSEILKSYTEYLLSVKETNGSIGGAEIWLEAFKRGIRFNTDAVRTSAIHSDGEGCVVLEKSSIPGDEETFNNGHGW